MSEVIVRVGETDNAVIRIDDQNTIKGKDGKDGKDGKSFLGVFNTFNDIPNTAKDDDVCIVVYDSFWGNYTLRKCTSSVFWQWEIIGSIKGPKGADGFSPIVDVEEIKGGHRITITDAVGDHVFDVMDGNSGIPPAGSVYVTDSQGHSWYVPTGEGEDAPVILDENGDAWHLLPGTGGEDDIAVTDGNGNDWHFARAGSGGGGSLPPGGTDGQYLVKDSTAEGGARWADLPVFEPTAGTWSVTPLVEAETTLHTAGNYLDRDIVVEAIPYAEVSNPTGGMTATIGG